MLRHNDYYINLNAKISITILSSNIIFMKNQFGILKFKNAKTNYQIILLHISRQYPIF